MPLCKNGCGMPVFTTDTEQTMEEAQEVHDFFACPLKNRERFVGELRHEAG